MSINNNKKTLFQNSSKSNRKKLSKKKKCKTRTSHKHYLFWGRACVKTFNGLSLFISISCRKEYAILLYLYNQFKFNVIKLPKLKQFLCNPL